MSPGMLTPYRVLDLTDGDAEIATFMLAGLGADVIKVEPPGGSSSRQLKPLAPDEPAEQASLHFQAYNRGKRSVVLDLSAESDRSAFLDLVSTADFVFENAGPGTMADRYLGFDELIKYRADLVYVAISPFGQDGPYADHAATDLTLAAMGGAMALNGDSDRRPVRVSMPQTWHHAAAESVLGAMVAHHLRLATGAPQFVDMSVQAAVFWTGLNAMISSAIDGRNLERGGTSLQLSTITTPLVYPCADGEICLFPMGSTLHGLIPWMRERGAVTAEWVEAEDWSTYETRVLTNDELTHPIEELRAKITEFALGQTKAEIFRGALDRGLTLVPVNTAQDTIEMEQLAVREYWTNLELPSGTQLQAPGPFVKASITPIDWPSKAPTIGEHTREVLDTIPEQVASVVPGPVSNGQRLPLEGVKVADFSWIGVGPITAKALADHGATVVHIESESPADRLRLVGPFKDDIAGINRCQFFGSFNTSKLSLQLDLKHPEGNDIARQLLAWCDIALDSFTAGTMDRLGLGYEVAKSLNPEIIMATTCLFGQYGPAANLAGYGYHAAAISGFYEITGWDDRPPGGPWNAYTDTVAPRFLTTTLLAALDHRRRTGQGQYIDQAQMESALHFQSPWLLDVQLSGQSPRRRGNMDPTRSPHDAYRCAGNDQWCAIAVETNEQWDRLRTALGNPSWAAAPELADLDGRHINKALIDDRLSDFTRQHAPGEVMRLLQEAGVPAGMVQRSSDHLQDPQLAHRDFFRPLHHPEMGEVPYEGHQYRINGYDNGPRMPAPCLGEHTFEVLTEILGFSADRAAEVLIGGACG